VWTPEPVWTTWRNENFCPHRDSNSKPSVFQPIASRYTDCAIQAHSHPYKNLESSKEINKLKLISNLVAEIYLLALLIPKIAIVHYPEQVKTISFLLRPIDCFPRGSRSEVLSATCGGRRGHFHCIYLRALSESVKAADNDMLLRWTSQIA
jgi:hypothetical protein